MMKIWDRLFQHKKLEQQLRSELDFHIEQQIRDNVTAGMSPEEARRQARLAFGAMDAVQEDCREARSVYLIESALQDVRYAVRSMRKAWIFSAVVVLSLGLGIGANTAIFTLADAVMWRMLPVQDPEHLFVIARTENGNPQSGFTYQQYWAMRGLSEVSEIAAYSPQRASVSAGDRLESTSEVHLVSGNYFSLLGVHALAGRVIDNEDDVVPNGHAVIVISYRYWTRRFANDPSVIGRTITLSGAPFTIIGVTPPEFFGTEVGTAPDFFVPMMMQPSIMPASENLLVNPIIYATWVQPLARLRTGVSAGQAAAALGPVYARNVPPSKFGGPPPRTNIILNSAATGLSALRGQFSEPLFILMALVAMILLIACANITNLLLARAAARTGEIALRLAIGATRLRLVRQLLVESAILTGLGGLCAIVFSQWAMRVLLLYVSSGRTPVTLDLHPNLRVLTFTAVVSLTTGIAFSLMAGVRTSRLNLTSAMTGLNVSNTTGASGPRKVLVVLQVGLSLVLLIGAGLFVRSLRNLNNQDYDLPRDRVLVVRVEPKDSDQRYRNGVLERLDRIYTDLLARVRAIPGVRSASLANVSPAKPSSGCCGAVDPGTGRVVLIPVVMVYPDFFKTMGLPIVRGNDFQATDFGPASPPVIVINETFARMRFNGEDPIGRMLGPAGRIIGVVKDSRYTSLKGPTPPTSYMPFLTARTGRGQMILYVRTAGDPSSIVGRVREEVWKADPTVPQFDVHTLGEEVDAVLVQERLIAMLSAVLGGLALLLASVGLYGLLAFAVVQRTGEAAVRIALGAARPRVVWMVLREALALVAVGVAMGLAAAVLLVRLGASHISGLLFGLKPADPITILSAAAILMVVAVVAAYAPARRVSRVDPMVALRNQ